MDILAAQLARTYHAADLTTLTPRLSLPSVSSPDNYACHRGILVICVRTTRTLV